jgi:hypothetical protein
MTPRDFLVVVCRRQLYDPCPVGSGTVIDRGGVSHDSVVLRPTGLTTGSAY